MSVNHLENKQTNESSVGVQRHLFRFVVLTTVLLILLPLLPGLISNLTYSFSGEAPKLYWYLSRAAGLVALTILWISMVLGLGITNKMARVWPGAPAAFAIHEFVSLLGLAFASYHGLVLIGDHFVDFSLPRLLTPFSIEYKTVWVGLGQIGFYVWIAVTASFYIRRLIGQKTWRLIHYVNFATYTMGVLHGIFSGTDSDASWVRWYYLVSAGSLLILLVYRVYESTLKRRKLSLAQFVRQRAQDLTRAATTLEVRALTSVEKHIQASLLQSQNLLSASSSNKESPSELKPSTVQAVVVIPEQTVINEKPELPASETPVIESPSLIAVNPPAEGPAVPVAEEKAPASALVEKYEQGTGKRKINIRIFKEPPEEQVIPVPQRDSLRQALPIDPLLMRLKKFFRATSIQPTHPEEKSTRVRILED